MNAKGRVKSVFGHGWWWWAHVWWTPDGQDVVGNEIAYLETAFYSTEPAAKQVAQDYAARLGLDVEWDGWGA